MTEVDSDGSEAISNMFVAGSSTYHEYSASGACFLAPEALHFLDSTSAVGIKQLRGTVWWRSG